MGWSQIKKFKIEDKWINDEWVVGEGCKKDEVWGPAGKWGKLAEWINGHKGGGIAKHAWQNAKEDGPLTGQIERNRRLQTNDFVVIFNLNHLKFFKLR
jgi:hypothetical protein